MKKLLLALCLLAGGAAQAQVTLEHSYPGTSIDRFRITKFSNGELKYVSISEGAAPVLTIYNENHSVLKQLTAPSVPNGVLANIDLVSDKLFNQDAAIEYIAVYEMNGSSNKYRVLAMSEAGQQLLAADSVRYSDSPYVVRGASGIKLIIQTGRFSETDYIGSYTKVYALGGTYVPLAAKAELSAATGALPYPNPTQAHITLPYEVAAGQLASLEVLDMAGRIVKQYAISSAFKSLELGANELAMGTYTYRVVSAAGSVTRGNKFIIN